MKQLGEGDFIRLTCGDRTVEATVLLASPNGRSLMLAFDALLDGHLGMMPVLQDEAGVYHAIVTDTVIEIEPMEQPDGPR
jgi:hypothetical protein